ncbi:MAG TPA: hypothetical protein VEZ90_10840 [Blastocatellia bacterium]|nr:hypothetical protein [Blastocatellia bacterium]
MAKAAKASSSDPNPSSGALKHYEELVATNPSIERKGATIPYTSLNGHMFSYLGKSGRVALRLPPKEREEFLKKYDTHLCDEYGVVQKEYVVVPDGLLKRTKELKKYFDLSLAYVGSLKPKGTGAKGKKTRK